MSFSKILDFDLWIITCFSWSLFCIVDCGWSCWIKFPYKFTSNSLEFLQINWILNSIFFCAKITLSDVPTHHRNFWPCRKFCVTSDRTLSTSNPHFIGTSDGLRMFPITSDLGSSGNKILTASELPIRHQNFRPGSILYISTWTIANPSSFLYRRPTLFASYIMAIWRFGRGNSKLFSSLDSSSLGDSDSLHLSSDPHRKSSRYFTQNSCCLISKWRWS